MMDIHLNKGINKNALLSLCSRYCGVDNKRIIISKGIDKIGDITDRSNTVLLNVIDRKYGDFKETIEIFEDEIKFGSYYDFALMIAKETKQTVLSDFDRKLKSSEWVLIDKEGHEITVEEDISITYPEDEDGITLVNKFKYLIT